MSVSLSEFSESLSAIIERVGRSVVRVEGGRRRPTSGVVWGPGRVITVAHGVEHEELVIAVDGAEFKARVKAKDEATDLALLEFTGELPAAEFDEGDALKVGQLALRVGRPGETVRATSGIISALGRKPFRAGRGGEIDRWLESDASHQPGFSGGALVSTAGQVLGMTTSGLLRGVSLNIPTKTLRRIVSQFEQHGRVRQSHLGLSLQPTQLPESVKSVTGDEVGLLVLSVEQGGPAESAGIAYGDTVLHLGDDSVRTLHDLYAYLRADHSGEQVDVRLFRAGQVVSVPLTIGAR